MFRESYIHKLHVMWERDRTESESQLQLQRGIVEAEPMASVNFMSDRVNSPYDACRIWVKKSQLITCAAIIRFSQVYKHSISRCDVYRKSRLLRSRPIRAKKRHAARAAANAASTAADKLSRGLPCGGSPRQGCSGVASARSYIKKRTFTYTRLSPQAARDAARKCGYTILYKLESRYKRLTYIIIYCRGSLSDSRLAIAGTSHLSPGDFACRACNNKSLQRDFEGRRARELFRCYLYISNSSRAHEIHCQQLRITSASSLSLSPSPIHLLIMNVVLS
ncbi:unnamed protein product [Trichogramma brassicae]|uniref:Uncharacterized protein n=1 Tax=Trichogramma brassicae TaxID=86971 RepID=A0A6H5HSX8_9HYME|nr:unnamed protein product [Trichogramma brassicae]